MPLKSKIASAPPLLEGSNQQQSGNKSADMGKPSNASADRWNRYSIPNLINEPKTQDYYSRDMKCRPYKEEKRDDHDDVGARKAQEVSAEDAGNSAAGAKHGDGRKRLGDEMAEKGRKSAEKIKEQKAEMAAQGFDVVAENPQVEHVAGQMKNAPMQKHGSNYRVQILSVDQKIGDCRILLNEGTKSFSWQEKLVDKDHYVGDDDCQRN